MIFQPNHILETWKTPVEGLLDILVRLLLEIYISIHHQEAKTKTPASRHDPHPRTFPLPAFSRARLYFRETERMALQGNMRRRRSQDRVSKCMEIGAWVAREIHDGMLDI